MKRTYRFVEPSEVVVCLIDGNPIEVPLVPGIFKHPTVEQLRELLTEPVVVRKYTCEALGKAPWVALRKFPRGWLVACLPQARLSDSRRRALCFLLNV